MSEAKNALIELKNLRAALRQKPESEKIRIALVKRLYTLSIEQEDLETSFQYITETLSHHNNKLMYPDLLTHMDHFNHVTVDLFENYIESYDQEKLQAFTHKLIVFLENNAQVINDTILELNHEIFEHINDVMICEMQISELIDFYSKINKSEYIYQVIEDALLIWDLHEKANNFISYLNHAIEADLAHFEEYISYKIQFYENHSNKQMVYKCYQEIIRCSDQLQDYLKNEDTKRRWEEQEEEIIWRANQEMYAALDEDHAFNDEEDDFIADYHYKNIVGAKTKEDELQARLRHEKEKQNAAYEKLAMMEKADPSFAAVNSLQTSTEILLDYYDTYITGTLAENEYSYWGEERIYSINIENHEKAIAICNRAINIGGNELYYNEAKEELLRRILYTYTKNGHYPYKEHPSYYEGYIQLLINLSPKNPYYHVVKANLLIDSVCEDLAEQYYDEYETVSFRGLYSGIEFIPTIYYVKDSNNVKSALKSYTDAIECDVNYFLAHQKKALLLTSIRDYEEAFVHCNKALKLCENDEQNSIVNYENNDHKRKQIEPLIELQCYILTKLGKFEEAVASLVNTRWYKYSMEHREDDFRKTILKTKLPDLVTAYQNACRKEPQKSEKYYKLLMTLLEDFKMIDDKGLWHERQINDIDTEKIQKEFKMVLQQTL
ncbi:tetratricopeptide repeat protein [Calidifontibacillus oryziterrae]|uniref:hypothetical protein n=1 Tax=Calidifontibacillus oryziterrae TaxID=1191699 RepID=UPI0002E25BE6|nr:hypothetical protein [Calidifontibacillus oryziterrae]